MFLGGLLLVKMFTLLRRKKSCCLRGIYCHNYSHHLVKLSEKTPVTYKINHIPYATSCQGPGLIENSLMETFLLYFSKETDTLQGTTLIHSYSFLIIGLHFFNHFCVLPSNHPLPHPSFIKTFAPKGHH